MELGPGMIMDILAAVILLFSVIRGAQKGFAQTLLSFVQWFACIIAGFFLYGYVKDYISENTTFDDAVHHYILDQITTSIEESTPYNAMPDLFSQWINTGDNNFIYGTAASLTNVVLTVLSFVAVIVVIKIICGVLALIFSKEYHDGLIGFLDGLVGLLFGLVRGILLVFLFFALLVPVLSLLPSNIADTIQTAMDQSYVASMLYNDNLLLILIRDLFS